MIKILYLKLANTTTKTLRACTCADWWLPLSLAKIRNWNAPITAILCKPTTQWLILVKQPIIVVIKVPVLLSLSLGLPPFYGSQPPDSPRLWNKSVSVPTGHRDVRVGENTSQNTKDPGLFQMSKQTDSRWAAHMLIKALCVTCCTGSSSLSSFQQTVDVLDYSQKSVR